ncbi:MAG: hemolysin III family protein [Paludibacteraceae bacterium]|nr:hemolysin III family protein [Paludibacteraceae bacterium]
MTPRINEEIPNTITHLIAFVATLLIAWPLLRLAYQSSIVNRQIVNLVGTSLFLLGMALMYASSTLYHAVSAPAHKRRLRVLDHISIYVMIAGSYSLICLSVVGGWLGWTVFIFLWTCVIAGIIGKTIALGKYPKLSLALYLAMGWTALLMLWPMWKGMPHIAFFWILAEGVFYTIGAYFFKHDEEHAYFHAIWHIFIILGSASHTLATYYLLTTTL